MPVAGSEIVETIKSVQSQKPYRRNDCPICGWTVEETKRSGLHCPFCGWTEFPIKQKRLGE